MSSAFPAFPAGYYLQGSDKTRARTNGPRPKLLWANTSAAYPGISSRRCGSLPPPAAAAARGASAITYLKTAVEKTTADTATLNQLGNAYLADGKPELALQQFEKAAALDSANPAIKTGVAISEIDIGHGQQGFTDLEQVYSSEAGAAIAGPTLVLRELGTGRIDKAAEVAASLIKRDADNPLFSEVARRRPCRATRLCRCRSGVSGCLERSPQFAAAAHDLGQLYVTTGRIDDATKLYDDLLSKDATDTTALVGLADIGIAQEKWPEAIDFLNNARAAAKFDPSPGLKLVRLYKSRRDWNSAKAVAADLSAQFPRDVNVIEARGRAQLEIWRHERRDFELQARLSARTGLALDPVSLCRPAATGEAFSRRLGRAA